MVQDEALSDDYVADILKKDARTSSIKYSALGMQAFLPRRPNGAAPKPNTRFLRNILRETDSHNAALLAKEQREAKRLQTRTELSRGHEGQDERDSRGDRRERKRRRTEDPEHRSRHRDHHHHHRRRSASPRRENTRESMRAERDGETDRRRHRHRERRERRRDREDQSNDDASGHHGSSPASRDKYNSRASKRDGNDDDEDQRTRRHKSRTEEEKPEHSSQQHHRRRRRTSPSPSPTASSTTTSSSDPLETLLGPLPPSTSSPPVQSRGRGTYTAHSTSIDTHFSATYNPRTDTRPHDYDYDNDYDDNDNHTNLQRTSGGGGGNKRTKKSSGDDNDHDDWAMALEAMRDRKRWAARGAERLREVGFGEDVVGRFEKQAQVHALDGLGTREKDERDVRWAKKGEGREWDRGKVVDERGEVDVRAEWAKS